MLGFGLGLNKWRRVGGGYVGLLDLFPNAAAAYSLRKLRAAYSGAAVRVRESGGNTEADIGFTSAGGLDTSALLAHCGTNNGLTTVKYDQAASINATQTTAANQAAIVNSGTIVDINGKPANDFDSTDFFLLSQPFEGGVIAAKSDLTFLVVGEFGSGANRDYLSCISSVTNGLIVRQTSTQTASVRLGSVSVTSTFTLSGLDGLLVYVDYGGDEITLTKISDGTTEVFSSISWSGDWGTSSGLTGGVCGISVNSFTGTGNSIDGKLGELVVWDSNLASSSASIRTNVKNFWGI